MRNNSDDVARQVLNNYLTQNNCRKTPERFAVLNAVFSFKSPFSIQNLSEKLVDEQHFPISRATIYNSLKLFLKLNLVVYHHLDVGIRYEACRNSNRSKMICTVCGKERYIDIPEVVRAIDNAHFKRFHHEGFSLSVYGICSTCLAKKTREKKKISTKTKVKQHTEKNETRQS